MILLLSRDEKEIIQRLRSLETLREADRVPVLAAEVLELKRQISELEIQKSKKQEDFERQDRELRHMIGLEKKRQAFEIEQAKKETELSVREGNLKAEQDRFTDQLKFNTERFQTMEKYLKDMFSDVLARLPNVNASLNIGKKR